MSKDKYVSDEIFEYITNASVLSNCCDSTLRGDICGSCREHASSQLQEDIERITGKEITYE